MFYRAIAKRNDGADLTSRDSSLIATRYATLGFPAFTVAKDQQTMRTGFVVWFNKFRGYGFIRPEEGGKDIFVHISEVERAGLSTLIDGQKLNYELISVLGKSAAADLKLAHPAV
jgi:CspA family cold shock protein